MTTLIDRFLGRWSKSDLPALPQETYAPAPGTEIRYSPVLVKELTDEHQECFQLHEAIVAAHTAKRFTAIPSLLKDFEALLNGHLITERVRLYAYMSGYFSHDARTRNMLRDYRSEMDRIGDSVVKLLRKYRDMGTHDLSDERFRFDFEEMRAVLAERMRREETVLYPLYMPVVA